MKVLCIKTTGAHWGTFYQKGKWYKIINTIEREITLIVDEENYFKKLLLIGESRKYTKTFGYNRNVPQEEMYTLIPGYLTLEQIYQKYCKKIKLLYYTIESEDKSTPYHQYIIKKRQDLIDEFGSDKFNTTEKFVEDNFITIEEYRESKLNILEI